MGLDALFGKTLTMLERAMDVRSAHHNRLVSNTVNIDTPGYQAFDTVIDEELARLAPSGSGPELKRTHPAHLGADPLGGGGPSSGRMMADAGYGRRLDRNTVNLEQNMAELQENQLVYSALTQIVSRKFRNLKDAIRGGS